jgi:hypothetical protein
MAARRAVDCAAAVQLPWIRGCGVRPIRHQEMRRRCRIVTLQKGGGQLCFAHFLSLSLFSSFRFDLPFEKKKKKKKNIKKKYAQSIIGKF